jgi:hypothetical protein
VAGSYDRHLAWPGDQESLRDQLLVGVDDHATGDRELLGQAAAGGKLGAVRQGAIVDRRAEPDLQLTS